MLTRVPCWLIFRLTVHIWRTHITTPEKRSCSEHGTVLGQRAAAAIFVDILQCVFIWNLNYVGLLKIAVVLVPKINAFEWKTYDICGWSTHASDRTMHAHSENFQNDSNSRSGEESQPEHEISAYIAQPVSKPSDPKLSISCSTTFKRDFITLAKYSFFDGYAHSNQSTATHIQ